MSALNLYKNQAVSFIAGRKFKYAGVEFNVGDEFDQELAPGRVEQLVRTRHIYPVVDDRADKTRFFHREIHVREDIDRILGKDRGKGQISLSRPDTEPVEGESVDVAAELKALATQNALTHQVLDEENAPEPEEDEQTEPAALITDGTDDHGEEIETPHEDDSTEDEVVEDDLIDPADYSVIEVNEYLDSEDTTDTERQRIFAAERNGKARKGILER